MLTAQSQGLLLTMVDIWFYHLVCPGVSVQISMSNSKLKAFLRLANYGDKFAFRELASTIVPP
jgi:hypothetical protein